MLNLLNIEKPLMVNGQVFPNSTDAMTAFKSFEGELEIVLNFKPKVVAQDIPVQPKVADLTEYRIKVRQYMTKNSSPAFDFMKKWNDDVPMPMRVMVGTILKETKGMYRMRLYCKPEPTDSCMVCGRALTHPVSVLYGIGPECGGHYHISPYETEEQLAQEMENLKEKLSNITWEGWIVKSACESMEAV